MPHMRKFIGRRAELTTIEALWNEGKSRLASMYGRRRVGKTALLQHFCEKKRALIFEALEGEDTAAQVGHFLAQLSALYHEPHLRDLAYHDWPPVFELLSQKIAAEKHLVLVFDEISWMASGRTRLISYIKYYWDKHWKNHPHLLLILCGSVASWMVKNIVRSTALYGRISENILVEPLRPYEVAQFISEKRGRREILEYLICFGGIPKYLEEFNFNQSIQLNIESTCFHKSGFFCTEAEKIFYSQFKETHLYQKIVRYLLARPLGLNDLAQKIKMPSGGGFKQYLENLCFAGIVEKSYPLVNFRLAKTPRYVVVDEFLRFHAQFIKPHLDEINHSDRSNRFEKFTRGRWFPFSGLAFERFCRRNRYRIATHLGCAEKVVGCGPAIQKGTPGVQYDLVYLRDDGVITLCEMKYQSHAIDTSIIREMETKLQRTNFPRGVTVERVLISNQKPSPALQDSGYFHRIIQADEIIMAVC